MARRGCGTRMRPCTRRCGGTRGGGGIKATKQINRCEFCRVLDGSQRKTMRPLPEVKRASSIGASSKTISSGFRYCFMWRGTISKRQRSNVREGRNASPQKEENQKHRTEEEKRGPNHSCAQAPRPCCILLRICCGVSLLLSPAEPQ